jgi:NAD(P)-dependent dehydrogenase (short-subunit alcohol dehydrogenase family)
MSQALMPLHKLTNSGISVQGKCDVTSWEDQVALFELGIKTYGRVDIVLPNAGVSEIGTFDPRKEADPTKLTPPNLKTLDIDLTGVLYTARIALFHWTNDKRTPAEAGLRAIVFTGSMSSFYGSDGVMYGAAKAGILGIQKGIAAPARDLNIRVATVCPYFSSRSTARPRLVLFAPVPVSHPLTPHRDQHPHLGLCPPHPSPRLRGRRGRRLRLRDRHH